jgi:hypothetical protein
MAAENTLAYCNLTTSTCKKLYSSGANPIKLLMVIIYGFLKYAIVFVPVKPFQPSQMFAGKASSLPCCGAPERYFTWVGSGLTCKHYTAGKA